MVDFEYLVIGKGLIGSAAVRYLSKYSDSVAVVGPDEPENQTTHEGVFASHYDQGRITRLTARNPIWSEVARLAIDNYRMLETQSGISFYNPVGLLTVEPPDLAEGNPNKSFHARKPLDLNRTFYEAGDRAWQEKFPHLNFPETYSILHEPAPAGYINPRDLICAQLTLATEKGVTIIQEVVDHVWASAGHMLVETMGGPRYRAAKVLVAAGAFTNCHHLLSQKLALNIVTETIILGRVSETDAEYLQDTPTVIYQINDPEIDDIYMTPPIRYPDGQFYIKMGANTLADQRPTTLDEMQDWFCHGDSDACKPDLERALRALWPDVEFLSMETKRCIVAYTSSGFPMIDQVADRIFVAAGGNGRSAKGSDTLGCLAAGLMHDGHWLPTIPRAPFRVRF